MGLARLDDALGATAAVQDGLTQSGQVMGTVDYMSPEQAVDTRTADAKADVYALGCTLHRLLIGENVYGGETLVQKLLAHREQPIPSLLAKRKDVPSALDEVFRKMVAKRPEDRMQSMREVIDALEELVRALKKFEAGATERNEGPSAFVVTETKPVGRKTNSSAKPQTRDAGRKKPPTRTLIAAGAAAAFLFWALGVWLIVRDKDGNEVARVQVPSGGSATIVNAPPTESKAASVESAPVARPGTAADVVLLGGRFIADWKNANQLSSKPPFSALRFVNLGSGTGRTNKNSDLYISRRKDVADPFAAAENLGLEVNSSSAEYDPCLSSDGRVVLFYSDRNGDRSEAIDALDVDATRLAIAVVARLPARPAARRSTI